MKCPPAISGKPWVFSRLIRRPGPESVQAAVNVQQDRRPAAVLAKKVEERDGVPHALPFESDEAVILKMTGGVW